MHLGLEGTSISAPRVVAAPSMLPCAKSVVIGVAQNAAFINSSPAAGLETVAAASHRPQDGVAGLGGTAIAVSGLWGLASG